MSDSVLSENILRIAFPQQKPLLFDQLVDYSCCDQWLDEFKLVVVLDWKEEAPTRITVSADGEEEAWLQRVLPLLSAQHQAILRENFQASRMVIDTSGTEHILFLDDLHQDGGTVMTQIYGPGPKEQSVAVLRKSALTPDPPLGILFHPLFLSVLSVDGMWAERRSHSGEIHSLLWISESRWRQNIAQTQAVIDRSNPPRTWHRLKDYLTQCGGAAYPDVVEFYTNGRIELSVAFLKEHRSSDEDSLLQ